jgi:hypothetical protein
MKISLLFEMRFYYLNNEKNIITMLKRGKKFIRSKDIIAPDGSSQLHIRSDIKQKNIFGGLVSILIQIYILYVAYVRGVQMLTNKDPILQKIELQDSSRNIRYID